jgi:hypothetical protein
MKGGTTLILCPTCKKRKPRTNSAINKAKKDGLKIYCGRACAGKGRRKENPVTPRNPNWKAMKAEYDRKRREKLGDKLRAKKKAAYAVWGPQHREKERENRKKRMPYHVEYCRQPKYKKYKVEYDRKLRAKAFGDFAECHRLLLQLTREINKQCPDRFEKYRQSGRHQWNPINQQRRRARARTKSAITDSE